MSCKGNNRVGARGGVDVWMAKSARRGRGEEMKTAPKLELIYAVGGEGKEMPRWERAHFAISPFRSPLSGWG